MKRFVALLLLIVTIVPNTVTAQFVVSDPGNTAQQTVGTIQSLKETLKEFKLDKIALKVAKKVLDRMTESVINWAAGGFKKSGPSFISNFDSFARTTAVQAGTLTIDEVIRGGEAYALLALSDEEKETVDKCYATESLYMEKYNVFKSALLAEYGSTPMIFDMMLVSAGYQPYYGDNASQPNEDALREYIEDTKFGVVDPNDTSYGNIAADERRLVEERQKCQTILLKKVQGLTYAGDLVSYLGTSYRNSQAGVANRIVVPRLGNLTKNKGQGARQVIAQNWQAWKGDASVGGWDYWGASAELENSPWGAKYALSVDLSNQLEQELAQKTQQLQRSGGFLDKGHCAQDGERQLRDGTKVCVKYESNTPGDIIRQTVAQKVMNQYDSLKNVDEWTDLLLATGVKMVTGVLDAGVLPLANNVVDRGLSCIAGDSANCDLQCLSNNCDGPYGQTNAISTEQRISNSGTYDDVVDIKTILYGTPKLLRDPVTREIQYELSSDLDYEGNPLPDYTRPKYVYETDASGNIVYETDPRTNAFLTEKVIDASGAIVNQKIPRVVRENDSAIFVSRAIVNLVNEQTNFIRNKGVRTLMELDHALPGPDYGWENRLDEVISKAIDGTDKPKLKSAYREIAEKIKSIFDRGISGYIQDDPTDIVVIGNPTASTGDRIAYTNPEATFVDYDPGIFELDAINTNGGIIPSMLTLTDSTGVTAQYEVVSMNTFAGTWKNPDTGKLEAVGNIPIAQEMRDMVNYVAGNYEEVFDNKKRRTGTLEPLIAKLTLLEERYRQMPYVGPDSNDEQRAARYNEERAIAYEISLIRDRIPLYDDLSEEKSRLETIQSDYNKMTNLIAQAEVYRNENQYAEKYGNLFLKDDLGMLYCALQDHGNLNRISTTDRVHVYNQFVKDRNIPANIQFQRAVDVAQYFSPVTALFNILDNSEVHVPTFAGTAMGWWDAKYVKKHWGATYGQMAPYRCFETSQVCSGDETTSDSLKCDGDNYHCPAQGHTEQDKEFLIGGFKSSCKAVYRSSFGQYMDIINPPQ